MFYQVLRMENNSSKQVSVVMFCETMRGLGD